MPFPIAIPGSVAEFAKGGEQSTVDALDAVFRTPNHQDTQQNGVSVDLETYKWQKIMEFREALDFEIAKKRQQAQQDIEVAERKKWRTLMEFQQALQGEIEQSSYTTQQHYRPQPPMVGTQQQYQQQQQLYKQHQTQTQQTRHQEQQQRLHSSLVPPSPSSSASPASQSQTYHVHPQGAPSPYAPMRSSAGYRPPSVNEMGPSLFPEMRDDIGGGQKERGQWMPNRIQSFDHQRSVATSNSSAYGVKSFNSAPARHYQSPYLNTKYTTPALGGGGQNQAKSSSSWTPSAPKASTASGPFGKARMTEAEELEKEYARLTGKKDIRATARENVKKTQEEKRKKLEALTAKVIENRRRFAHEVKVADRPLEISFSLKDKKKKAKKPSVETREDVDSSDSDDDDKARRRRWLSDSDDDTTTREDADTTREETTRTDETDDSSTRDFLDLLRDRRAKAREDGDHRDFFSILPKTNEPESYSRDDVLKNVQKKKVILPSRDPKEARMNRKKSSQKLTESRPWNQKEKDKDFHPIRRKLSSRSRGRATRRRAKSNGRSKSATKSQERKISTRSSVEKRVERRKSASRSRAAEKGRTKSAGKSRGSKSVDRSNRSQSRITRKPDKDLTQHKRSDTGSSTTHDDDERQRNRKAAGQREVPAKSSANIEEGTDEDAEDMTPNQVQDTRRSNPRAYAQTDSTGIDSEDEDNALAKAFARAMGKITLTANSNAEGFEIEEPVDTVKSPEYTSVHGGESNSRKKNADSEYNKAMDALKALEDRLNIDDQKGESILPQLLAMTKEYKLDLQTVVKHFVKTLPEVAKSEFVDKMPLCHLMDKPSAKAFQSKNGPTASEFISPLKTSERADPYSPRSNTSGLPVIPDFTSPGGAALEHSDVRDPAPSPSDAVDDSQIMSQKSGRSRKSQLDESLTSYFSRSKFEDSVSLKYSDLKVGGIKLDELSLDPTASKSEFEPTLSPRSSRGGWRERLQDGRRTPTSPGRGWRERLENDMEGPITPRSPLWTRENTIVESSAPTTPVNTTNNLFAEGGTVWSAPFHPQDPTTSPKSPEGWRERIRQNDMSSPRTPSISQVGRRSNAKPGINMSSVRQSLNNIQAKRSTKQQDTNGLPSNALGDLLTPTGTDPY